MGTLILFTVILVVAFIVVFKEVKKISDDGDGWGFCIMAPAAISFLASCLITLLFAVILMKFEPEGEHVRSRDTPIYSLAINGEIAGRFMLGSGSVKETLYYYYYRSVRGGYKLSKVEVDGSIIYESDGTPCLRKKIYRRTGFWRFMFGDCRESDINELHIPRGSIIRQYNPNI